MQALLCLGGCDEPDPEVSIDCFRVSRWGDNDLEHIRATVTPPSGEPYRVVSEGGIYWFRTDTWDELGWREKAPLNTAVARIENQRAFGIDVEQRWCDRLPELPESAAGRQ